MTNLKTEVESVNAENTEQAPNVEANSTESKQVEVSSTDPNNFSESNETADSEKKKKRSEVPLIPLPKLIDSGIHIGLKPNKWNPKMKPFIYTKKFNHIIDIRKTTGFLEKAFSYLVDVVRSGGEVIFVGTKNKLVRNLIKSVAERVGVYYVTQRWLGGTLTNFKHISHSIKKLNDLDVLLADESLQAGRTKKELLDLTRDRDKLEKFYGGIKNMTKIPQVLVCFDPVEDINSVLEAKKVGIPVVAVANTNADPLLADFIIPANNFSIRSAYLIVNVLGDAIAYANDNPTVVAYRSADDIVLPEIQRRHNLNRGKRNNYSPTRTTKVQVHSEKTEAKPQSSEAPNN
ncbi:small subunit ribosomal protein S2 [Mycoplasmoides fastidiosum]|uniref:Small ribosomal subunit protein uS2 n=1 Tax=Mycoplasmoides fastidiosum TaxID=92758 RepID=A0ABU0LYI7_9BACT|nr:30S ribosomal protein S2 [Mycoplasmoides fastidiosum]MDQ0513744.1 small subunit ribosomal protein S2 [Mycoplasmoides fastidiosum]UUD37835.1 30S ribosomal protein S2 [Mycoplasmoides fastidiosum]